MIKNLIKTSLGMGNVLRIKSIIKPFKIEEITIDISASCNAQCPFCPRIFMPKERSKGFMTLELYEKILDDAKVNNIKKLRLYSTAEPTMHPKFDKIIDIAKEKEFEVSLSTNGSLIHKYMESIAKVDLLQYSIEGWDKESYEKYRFPLKFDRTFENIKAFYEFSKDLEKKPKISTNLLITKNTDIKKYVELWGEYVGDINIHFMYEPVKYENGKFVAKTLDTQNEYFELDKQTKDFYCSYPFEILMVAYDGKVALCCDDFAAELKLGDLNNMSIKEVFNSKKMQDIRKQFYTQKLDLCKECSRFTKAKKEDIDLINFFINNISLNSKNNITFNFK
ncbi:radical SAM/SPASM domain-containing protein [Aliarcobacter butzleri]|uniref:radical SAM/SPASM domain-containing protein n=1 Tax=Aliarcobacter butzleri TaxID=28197 RepID=UPI00189F78C7|nr:radical SAM protein [Aliarcobacter butzleri]MBF7071567.1 radical SAM/SPASM domain-containing protein [Aliarcobacter butzleri]